MICCQDYLSKVFNFILNDQVNGPHPLFVLCVNIFKGAKKAVRVCFFFCFFFCFFLKKYAYAIVKMANEQDILSFCDITGASIEVANQFLEV